MTHTERKRSTTMTIRLTDNEKKAIAAKARSKPQTITEYILGVVFMDESEAVSRHQSIMKQMKEIADKLDVVSEQLKSQDAKSVDFQDIIDAQNELKAQMMTLSARM